MIPDKEEPRQGGHPALKQPEGRQRSEGAGCLALLPTPSISKHHVIFVIGILVKTCLLCLQELLHSIPWLLSLLLLVVAHLLSQIDYEESSRLLVT